MCGISGILNYQGKKDRLEIIGRKMLDTLQHRGPDGDGIWTSIDDGLLMGHRRLAIQDLSEHGAQPMFSRSGRYCVVFNGEIYNFKELSYELTKAGHTFKGHSDSEVLLEAIDKWGLDKSLQRFIGMFAFALWDVYEKTLYLCRDRLGEKPLYYGNIDKTIFFASELKAIEAVTNKSHLRIDKVGLNCFLKYGYINAPQTIYQDIYKLPPATILAIRNNDLNTGCMASPKPYWSISEVISNSQSEKIIDEREALEQLDVLLNRTIRRQLIADVPVGTFLSGGIDSTLVSAIAKNVSTDNIKTFTIGFSEKDYDESRYAKDIAAHIGSNHQTIYVTSDDALNVIPDLSLIYDEPFADSSQIPTYLVSKIAKQQVTVCLSGDGGDELFGGYNRYFWLSQIWNKIEILPKNIRGLIGKLLSIPSPQLWEHIYSLITLASNKKMNYRLLGLKIQKLAGLLQQEDIQCGYDYLISYWGKPQDILSSEFQSDYSNLLDKYTPSNDFVENAMYWDQITYLPGDNLAKVDRASMRVSLETRLPLLSHEILELSWRLPLAFKIKNKVGKLSLRKVLDQYVPQYLLDRPKMGFSVPISKWLRNELREWAEDLFHSNQFVIQDMFQHDKVEKVWKEHLSGKSDHSHRLWTLLILFSWMYDRQ